MKVSFDGLRKNLAGAYEETITAYRDAVDVNGYDDSFSHLKDGLNEMRSMIAAFLCCYDEESIKKDNDFHDLGELADKLPFADPEDGD